MKLLFVAVFLPIILAYGSTLSYNGQLVGWNKTPKVNNNWTDACLECQTIIKRIVAVATDPTKVEELKILLSALCDETEYKAECKLFVNKLDKFLDKLLPYLSNAEKVCKELHICSNHRIEHFHRVGFFFASQLANEEKAKSSLLCEECQFAAREVLDLISEPHVQQDLRDWLQSSVCNHLGRYKEMCGQYLDEMLPEFWQELRNVLSDQKKFCEDLELCSYSARMTTAAATIPHHHPQAKLGGRLIGMMKSGSESEEEN